MKRLIFFDFCIVKIKKSVTFAPNLCILNHSVQSNVGLQMQQDDILETEINIFNQKK